MALPDLTGQNIQDTYKRVLHVHSDGQMYDGTGSIFIPLSASHEINIEVSSSYAQTASFIANGVHSLTSTEVDQLKNISSSTISENQWSYVGNMNQDVSTTSVVNFSRISIADLYPTSAPLLLPTEATPTSPHMMTRNAENDLGPSLFLGDRSDSGDLGTKLISFVNQNEDEVAYITQGGTMTAIAFSGTVSTATTATNFDPAQDQTLNNNIDILGKETGGTSRHMLSMSPSNVVRVGAVATPLSLRSSGAIHITGSFIGNITASGDISASGTIKGLDYEIGNRKFANASAVDSNGIELGNGGTGNLLLTNLTASGDISSSGGTVTAKQLTLDHASRVDIKFTNEGDEDHYIRKDGDFLRFRGHDDSTVLLELRNNTNGSNATSFPNGNHGIGTNNPGEKLEVVGNISASGTIIANKIESDQLISHVGDANTGLQFAADTVDIESNNVVIGKFSSKLIQLNRSVTASADISASGHVYASDFTLGGGRIHFSNGNSILINQNAVNFSGTQPYFFSQTNITASGDISASGEIIADTLTGTINGGSF
jgi:hypothetical protein